MQTIFEKSPLTQQIEGNWKQFTGKVREQWGDLTDDDLDRFQGQLDQLEGYIQERTGEKRTEIRKRIEAIASAFKGNV